MKELFAGILNISISAGILIVVCVLVRLLFRNMPKYIRCLMWLLVAVRLAIPFAIESPFSLLPAREYVTATSEASSYDIASGETQNIGTTSGETQNAGTAGSELQGADNAGINQVVTETGKTSNTGALSPSIDWMFIFSIVWIIGVLAVLTYAIVAYVRLRRLVADAVLLRDNIYQSERTETAFVLGIISPKIYIPYGLSVNELYMSINHERAHLARRDHLVKPLGFIITAVYWFNPLVWLAYILLCRDIELACDEKVIKKIGYDKKKDYSQALLNLSIPKSYIKACPVAFGEVGINERVKNVLKMKKGKKIIIAAAALVCVVLGICFLTYPKTKDKQEDTLESQVSEEHFTEESTAVSEETASDVDENAEDTDKVVKTTDDSGEEVASAKKIEVKLVDGDDVTNEYYIASVNASDENGTVYVLKLNDKDGAVHTINLNDATTEGLQKGNLTLYIDVTNGCDAYTIDEKGEINANLTAVDVSPEREENAVVLYADVNSDSDEKVYVYTEEDAANYVQETHDTSNGSEANIVKLSTRDDATKEIIWPISGNGNITRTLDDNHQGTDIAAADGTDVVSVFDGTVEEVGFDDTEGEYIIITNEDGWKVKYSHLQEKVVVAKGDKVNSGDVVGAVGNTGQSTGPHLHLELYNETGEQEPPILIMTE
ncbi:Signal transducer regulating beta-lactamase production, contains metallopeptidase domain [Lachnospiraceae bacterium NE2001]|nr:Signal transducer regulating beta-lactamase production, contains metallopeptidase domain [Lachnospiraceae bacterium NE2001]